MRFPIISKFNTELVKKVEVATEETISNELFFKHSMAITSKGIHLTLYDCPGYQQVSQTYQFLTSRCATRVTFGQGH